MDLDNVRINSGKIFRNGEFNAQESLYWSNIYVGDAVREVTEQLKDINKNLEKIANKDININTNNYTTPSQIKEFIHPYDNKNKIWCDTNIHKDSHVDKNIILD